MGAGRGRRNGKKNENFSHTVITLGGCLIGLTYIYIIIHNGFFFVFLYFFVLSIFTARTSTIREISQS